MVLSTFLKAVFFIFAAEMGDKTQILAMTLATRFKLSHVILGIFIGALLNHGLAVAGGALLGTVIPISVLQVFGGLAFLGFGLWTLKLDEDEEEESIAIRFHPVYTVAFAFFVGELGDKTQLAAISLAMDSPMPLLTLAGTVTGMMITSGIGIFLGRKLGNKLSENKIKAFSFVVFTAFGVFKLISPEAQKMLGGFGLLGVAVLWVILCYWLGKPRYEAWKSGQTMGLERTAQRLKEKLDRIEHMAGDLCLGETACGTCMGAQCQLGRIRHILGAVRRGESVAALENPEGLISRKLDPEKTLQAYLEVAALFQSTESLPEGMTTIRKLLEEMVLGHSLAFEGWESYVKAVEREDEYVADLLKKHH